VVKRALGLLSRALYYRALELARERKGPETCPDCKGTGGKRTRDGKLRCWTCQGNGLLPPYPGLAPDLRRYPASHSSGPPHVEGTVPPPPDPDPTVSRGCALTGHSDPQWRGGCGCG
jgi:hypothetical protein